MQQAKYCAVPLFLLGVLIPGTGYGVVDTLPEFESSCVNVQKIQMIGEFSNYFSWAAQAANKTQEGEWDSPIGRCLGANGINKVMQRIQHTIIQQGFVTTRVLIGPQKKLSEGILELTLMPGALNQISFTPNSSPKISLWNVFPKQAQGLLNLRDVEQGLDNLKRLPTAKVHIQLQKPKEGAYQPGKSDILLNYQQSFPWRFHLALDNSGTQTTGRYRASAGLAWDNPLRLSDILYVGLHHTLSHAPRSQATRGYALHYSLPLHYWLFAWNVSGNSRHQLIPGINQSYAYREQNQDHSFKISRVLYRNSQRKTQGFIKFWDTSSQSYLEDTKIEVQSRRIQGWDIGISHREKIQQATLDADLYYHWGLKSDQSYAESPFFVGSEYPKIVFLDSHLSLPFQYANQAWHYQMLAHVRWNLSPLAPADRLVIGGRHTVRGFDGAKQLMAERGWFVRNDMGLLLYGGPQELYIGMDYGHLAGPSARQLVGQDLSGAILGFRRYSKGFSWELFLAKPLYKPQNFESARGMLGVSLSQNW